MSNENIKKGVFLILLITVLSLGTLLLRNHYVVNMRNKVEQVKTENQELEGNLLYLKNKYKRLFDMEIFTSSEISNKIPDEFDYFDVFNDLVFVPTQIADVMLNKFYIEEDNSFVKTHNLPEELGAIKISVIISTDDFDSISTLFNEINDTKRVVLVDSISYSDLSFESDTDYTYTISITYYAFYEKETLN